MWFATVIMGSSSQSPQTGQVYFNPVLATESTIIGQDVSQSPQTGQVYFNIKKNGK